MFRIHFDPKLGRFIVQVQKFGVIWVNVMGLKDDNSGVEALTFKTFDEAVSHVKSIGLDKLYADKSANKFREYMSGKGYTRMTDGKGNVLEYQ